MPKDGAVLAPGCSPDRAGALHLHKSSVLRGPQKSSAYFVAQKTLLVSTKFSSVRSLESSGNPNSHTRGTPRSRLLSARAGPSRPRKTHPAPMISLRPSVFGGDGDYGNHREGSSALAHLQARGVAPDMRSFAGRLRNSPTRPSFTGKPIRAIFLDRPIPCPVSRRCFPRCHSFP